MGKNLKKRGELAKTVSNDVDLSAEFESEVGEVLTLENIAMAVRYENTDVEQVKDGYMVDGEVFTAIE